MSRKLMADGLRDWLHLVWNGVPGRGEHAPGWGLDLLMGLLVVALVAGGLLLLVAWQSALEARLARRVDGPGLPGRAARGPLARALALLTRQEVLPVTADRILATAAPLLALAGCLGAFALMPLGPGRTVPADLATGLLLLLWLAGLQGFALLLGAMTSGYRLPLLATARAAIQLGSFLPPALLTLLTVVLLSGSLSLQEICTSQSGHVLRWYVFRNPFMLLAFAAFGLSTLALCQRAPFDTAAQSPELAGGVTGAYQGARRACVVLSQRSIHLLAAGVGACVFLGGWLPGWPAADAWIQAPGPAPDQQLLACLAGLGSLLLKTQVLLLLHLLLRWASPRILLDGSVRLAIRVLLPWSLAGLLGAALWQLAFPDQVWFLPRSWL